MNLLELACRPEDATDFTGLRRDGLRDIDRLASPVTARYRNRPAAAGVPASSCRLRMSAVIDLAIHGQADAGILPLGSTIRPHENRGDCWPSQKVVGRYAAVSC